jgi:hypothetical protein
MVAVGKMGGHSDPALQLSFLGSREGWRKDRLNGWKLWEEYASVRGITPETMKTTPNPASLMTDFVADMQQRAVSEHGRKVAMPAVQQLFDMLRTDASFSNNSFLRLVITNASVKVKSVPRYTHIWPLEQLLHYITNVQGDPTKLPWTACMATAAVAFMVFGPCRPIALIRADPTLARPDPTSNAILVPIQDKTDHGHNKSMLCIRDLPQKYLSPRFWFDFLSERSARLGCPHSLFCSNLGRPYVRTDAINKAGKALLGRARIHPAYGFYSTRHSMISKLYTLGFDEKQVNAYTGHSNNHHTTLNFYYHLDTAWLGSKMASACETAALLPVSSPALNTLLADTEATNAEEIEAEATLGGIDAAKESEEDEGDDETGIRMDDPKTGNAEGNKAGDPSSGSDISKETEEEDEHDKTGIVLDNPKATAGGGGMTKGAEGSDEREKTGIG